MQNPCQATFLTNPPGICRGSDEMPLVGAFTSPTRARISNNLLIGGKVRTPDLRFKELSYAPAADGNLPIMVQERSFGTR